METKPYKSKPGRLSGRVLGREHDGEHRGATKMSCEERVNVEVISKGLWKVC